MRCSLTGIILNENKQPIEDATVMIAQSEGSVHDIAAISNDNGEFAFHDLSKGKTTLRVIHFDQDISKELFLTEKETHIVFKLK